MCVLTVRRDLGPKMLSMGISQYVKPSQIGIYRGKRRQTRMNQKELTSLVMKIGLRALKSYPPKMPKQRKMMTDINVEDVDTLPAGNSVSVPNVERKMISIDVATDLEDFLDRNKESVTMREVYFAGMGINLIRQNPPIRDLVTKFIMEEVERHGGIPTKTEP